MSKENMGRNAEHYADPTPTAAMRNICRDEYQKEAARLDRIGDIVPLLRQMAGIAGFEIIGRIPLRDKHRKGVQVMAQHYKIDCDKVEDRKALVVVLSMNGYTVRVGKEKRSGKSTLTYFVEYWRGDDE